MRFTNLLKYKKREWCLVAKSVKKRGPTLVICELRAPCHIEKYRKIWKKCSLSLSSAVRICTEGTDAQGHKKRTGRPPIMSRRDRSDL